MLTSFDRSKRVTQLSLNSKNSAFRSQESVRAEGNKIYPQGFLVQRKETTERKWPQRTKLTIDLLKNKLLKRLLVLKEF